MRAFSIAVLVAVLLAIGWWFGLSTFQRSSADAFASSSTRLNQQEAVDLYGRRAD